MRAPESASVEDDTVVTLTGRVRGSAGSFWAVTVTGGNVIDAAGVWPSTGMAPSTDMNAARTRRGTRVQRTSNTVNIRELSHGARRGRPGLRAESGGLRLTPSRQPAFTTYPEDGVVGRDATNVFGRSSAIIWPC